MPICERCGKEHNGSYGTGRFCSKYCANVRIFSEETKRKLRERIQNRPKKVKLPVFETRICKRCGKEFEVDITKEDKKHPRNYCSLTCRNTHPHREETKQKIRQSILNNLSTQGYRQLPKRHPKPKELKWFTCKNCGKQYSEYTSKDYAKSLFCCKKCRTIYRQQKALSQQHGSPCKGRYKDIQCDSKLELAFLIYCLEHNIKIIRCKDTFEYEFKGIKHLYNPDFIINDNVYIEIKGWDFEVTKIKLQAVKDSGCVIHILFKKDLQKCFDYIKKQYGVTYNNLDILYDPKRYEHTCCICGKTFLSKRKNQLTCSTKCATKLSFRHLINDTTGERITTRDKILINELLEKGWRFGTKLKT